MLRLASHEISFEGVGAYLEVYFWHYFTEKAGKDDWKSWNMLAKRKREREEEDGTRWGTKAESQMRDEKEPEGGSEGKMASAARSRGPRAMEGSTPGFGQVSKCGFSF